MYKQLCHWIFCDFRIILSVLKNRSWQLHKDRMGIWKRNLVSVTVANGKRRDKLKEKMFYGQFLSRHSPLLDLRDSLVFRFIKLYFIESHTSSSAIDSDCKLLWWKYKRFYLPIYKTIFYSKPPLSNWLVTLPCVDNINDSVSRFVKPYFTQSQLLSPANLSANSCVGNGWDYTSGFIKLYFTQILIYLQHTSLQWEWMQSRPG